MKVWIKDGKEMNCENCAFSQRLDPNHVGDDGNLLQCRRFPPSVALQSDNEGKEEAYYRVEGISETRVPALSFLFVQGNWFCGEHHALRPFLDDVSVEIR